MEVKRRNWSWMVTW